MEATVDYEPVVAKLLEKSQQGRLNWERGFSRRASFTCAIEGGFTFESEKGDDGYQLTMKDPEGNEIFSITGEEAVVYDHPKKEELFNTLREIYDLARKKALNIDEKLATAAGLLDKV